MQYYGQFDPPVDQFLHERYFLSRKNPGFFIECGAFDGQTECSCKFFEESLGWKGINIEPSPPIFEKLQQNRPASTNLNLALSNSIGTATFSQPIHPTFGEQCTNGSLTHLSHHYEWLVSIGCSFKDYSVPTLPWRELVKQHNIQEVDLLVLDVEGHELSVIDGMKGCPILPKLICIEHGQLGIEVVKSALCSLGYQYDTSSNVNSFFLHMSPLRFFFHKLFRSIRQKF